VKTGLAEMTRPPLAVQAPHFRSTNKALIPKFLRHYYATRKRPLQRRPGPKPPKPMHRPKLQNAATKST
jgi:hypothetical protein